jgi:hypothetical protein
MTQLTLEEVKKLHEIVYFTDNGYKWLLDRMKELKKDIPVEDWRERSKLDLQAVAEHNWRQQVALVNLALSEHCKT